MREAAEAVAARLGLGLQVVSVEARGDSENELRRARYAALEGMGHQHQPLVLGHTADDQVETVLINLIRGSGVSGLAGMPRMRGRLVRPLLTVWRSELREAATLLELPWRDDPANQDLRHLRNRIRLGLIPDVERRLSTDFKRTLLRTAGSVRDESEVLADIAGSIPVERRSDGFRVALGAARAAGRQRAALVLRRELARLRSGLPPDRAAVERAMEVLAGRRRSAQLGDGIVVHREGAFCVIGIERPASQQDPAAGELVPGSFTWGRFRFDVSVVDRVPVIPLSAWATVFPVRGSSVPRIRPATSEEAQSYGLSQFGASWPVVDLEGRLVWIPGVSRFRWENVGGDRYLCAVAEEESDWARYEP
jgi:tRNA(Ile)-lysidine synthase TilS/MesJ